MGYEKVYERWLTDPYFDDATKKELRAIEGDDEEIEDRFYSDLKFGTAGLRGKVGAGANRMNIYTVGRATQGFAEVIKSKGEEAMKRGVAISYDVRHMSKEFSRLTASVFAANGIKVYIYDEIQPTPVLSYTIRHLHTQAGVMVTASHNPMEYNGYKAYWEEGSQILDDVANEILEAISKIDYPDVKTMDFEEGMKQGLIEWVPESVIEDYFKDIFSLTINDEAVDKDINIVYSPLNGCGNKLVRRVLKERGFHNVHVVKEQENPDPNFTTVGYPNPENPAAFELSEKLGHEVGAEILIATDPDSDRLAVEVLNEEGGYTFVNGNRIGALMVHYILSQLDEKGKLPKNGVVVKSLVTGDLTERIAQDYGVEMIEVLTGFKNIAAPANEYDKTGEKTFIFGFEESIGFNYGTFVRDKDAVSSAMILAEMAGFYKKKGKNLLDVLNELYEKYGYYRENLISITLEGLDGKALIDRIMENFRHDPLEEIGDMKLVKVVDYENDETGLPKSNVLKYYYDDKSWFALRPSGTEPKIKLYIYSVGKTLEEGDEKLERIEKAAKDRIAQVK